MFRRNELSVRPRGFFFSGFYKCFCLFNISAWEPPSKFSLGEYTKRGNRTIRCNKALQHHHSGTRRRDWPPFKRLHISDVRYCGSCQENKPPSWRAHRTDLLACLCGGCWVTVTFEEAEEGISTASDAPRLLSELPGDLQVTEFFFNCRSFLKEAPPPSLDFSSPSNECKFIFPEG